jgi:predicted ribosomally synthesized peptide with SipW-like signal peptide
VTAYQQKAKTDMKTKVRKRIMRKSLITGILVSLIGLIAAGTTIAWLTSTAQASNTFTVGDINISLTESAWPNPEEAQSVYPGAIIDKNPVVTVDARSEDCFVYVVIDNGLNQAAPGAVELDLDEEHWVLVSESGSKKIYCYCDIIGSSGTDQNLSAVFTKVTVSSYVVTEANIALFDGKAIYVKAYAHQAGATTSTETDAKAIAFFSAL